MDDIRSPHIAIVAPNTLAVLGLTHLLESVMPMLKIDAFGSFSELNANNPERYFHYFADMRIVIANMAFFLERRHKTIVLTETTKEVPTLGNFHTICVCQPEKQLLRSLLVLEQHAHAHGRNLPHINKQSGMGEETVHDAKYLSRRETEVMSLIVKGLINKEIAERLNISLPTVDRKSVV